MVAAVNPTPYLSQAPEALKLQILSYLDLFSLVKMGQVDKNFQILASRNVLWLPYVGFQLGEFPEGGIKAFIAKQAKSCKIACSTEKLELLMQRFFGEITFGKLHHFDVILPSSTQDLEEIKFKASFIQEDGLLSSDHVEALQRSLPTQMQKVLLLSKEKPQLLSKDENDFYNGFSTITTTKSFGYAYSDVSYSFRSRSIQVEKIESLKERFSTLVQLAPRLSKRVSHDHTKEALAALFVVATTTAIIYSLNQSDRKYIV